MSNVFFKSEGHKQRLLAAMQEIGKIDAGFGHSFTGKFDPEYASALYILTADLGTWQKSQDYVSQTGIDFEAMIEEVDLSSGYSILVRLAGNLFSGNEHIDPLEFMRLDEPNFQAALTAITIRRDALNMSDFD